MSQNKEYQHPIFRLCFLSPTAGAFFFLEKGLEVFTNEIIPCDLYGSNPFWLTKIWFSEKTAKNRW